MRLSEIATEIYCGSGITGDQIKNSGHPAIKCGDLNSKLKNYFYKCITFTDENMLKHKKYFEYGDILISQVGDKKTVGSVLAYLGKEKGIAAQSVHVLKHKQNPIFLSYMLSSKLCRKQIEQLSYGGAILNLYIKEAKKIQIPLPPLEEQEEIVSKLDKFRKITEDFEEGIPKLLKLVEKQYEYYKEEIFKYCH